MTPKIQDLIRAQDVKRWHIVATNRIQTLAEHQYNVCMFARAICSHMDIKGEDLAKITEMALLHDADEVVWGDPPTPTKEKLAKQGFKWPSFYETDTEWEHYAIIKVADIMDAVWFLERWGVGSHANKILNELIFKVDYMIQHSTHSLADAIANVNRDLYEGDLTT